MRLDWRRVVVYSHRWLGIAGSLLFVAWFGSGVVMMYARMPRLTPEGRLMRAAALDIAAVRLAPADAARVLSHPPERLRIGMLLGRPVYRFHDRRQWTTVFADSGETLRIDASSALDAARAFVAPRHRLLTHDGYVREPDQWTLQIRDLLPAHRIAIRDEDDTRVYVSERTGEVVLVTTRRTRLLGYAGAIVHWIYFTPLRRHGDVWAQVMIWVSIGGCVLCLLGIGWGVWRYSPSRRYRLRRVHAHSPYAGMMRWHHYAGLTFGVVTFTWIFSGLLSMDPWSWSPSTAPSAEQRMMVAGGRFDVAAITPSELRAAAEALASSFVVKELELVRFQGVLFAEAYRSPAPDQLARDRFGDPGAVVSARLQLDHQLVALKSPARPFAAFQHEALMAAARDLVSGAAIQDAKWLDRYDAYYYDRHHALPLPVLRVRYSDQARTWLYLDPRRGEILRKEERLSRINRWIYHGLHSFDFPWLYQQRPLWDAVVILLSAGGITLSLTSIPPAFRRLRRHIRRARASFRSSSF